MTAVKLPQPLAQPLPQQLSWALWPLALVLPLNEGIATALLLLLLLQFGWYAWQQPCWPRFAGSQLLLCLAVWWLAGCCANQSSGFGYLRLSSVFRYLPYAWFALSLLVAQAVAWRLWWQVAGLALFGCWLAAAIGCMDVWFDLSWLEQLLRKPGGAVDQAYAPFQPGVRAAGGLFFHRLKLASVLLLPLCAAVVALLAMARRPLWRWLVLGPGLLILIAALLWTYMRAAQVAWLAGSMAVALLFYWQRSWYVLALLPILGVLLLCLAPEVAARLGSSGDLAVAIDRAAIWREAIRVLYSHPFGIGFGNYPSLVDRYYQLDAPYVQMRTYAHNLLLSGWAEAGWVGLAAMAGFWGQLGWLFWQAVVKARQLAAVGLMLWLNVWLVGFTHDVFWAVGPGQLLLCAFGWLAGALLRSDVLEGGEHA